MGTAEPTRRKFKVLKASTSSFCLQILCMLQQMDQGIIMFQKQTYQKCLVYWFLMEKYKYEQQVFVILMNRMHPHYIGCGKPKTNANCFLEACFTSKRSDTEREELDYESLLSQYSIAVSQRIKIYINISFSKYN